MGSQALFHARAAENMARGRQDSWLGDAHPAPARAINQARANAQEAAQALHEANAQLRQAEHDRRQLWISLNDRHRDTAAFAPQAVPKAQAVFCCTYLSYKPGCRCW